MINIEHKHYFDTLSNRLKKLDDIKIVTVPGNIGDYIIIKGAMKFLDFYSIPYTMCEADEIFEPNSNIIILANGNLTIYNDTKIFIERNIKKNNNFIFLSASICEHNKFLYNLNKTESIEFWTREKVSHGILTSLGIKSTLTPDFAFYLDKEDFEPKKVDTWGCTFYRVDKESTISEFNDDINIDISNAQRFHKFSDTKVKSFQRNYKQFVNMIHSSDKVISNRLHVCLIAIILDKEVEMYSESYYKIDGVYHAFLTELNNVKLK